MMMNNGEMIKSLKERGYLFCEEVERAMEKVDRILFVPERYKDEAYFDTALPLLKGATISAPSVIAFMLCHLSLFPSAKVLEIGTGSGYSTAVIAEMVGEGVVVSIEKDEDVAKLAERNLSSFSFANVKLLVGDGSCGWEEDSPYDRIIVNGALPHIPRELVDQLSEGGVLIAPVGGKGWQKLIKYEKETSKATELLDVVFVPIIGKCGFPPYP